MTLMKIQFVVVKIFKYKGE
ncbi:hypothetical protein A2U01_0087499, partial [Trifolium medium]|nr:hypothetical protein [Trifolium medium]